MRQQYGYGVVLNVRLSYQPVSFEIDDPNVAIQESLSEAESRAYGQALGVCVDEAFERVPDPFAQDTAAANWLATQALRIREEAWEDPRVQAAIDGWSRCMAEAGYDFAHPQDAHAYVAEMAEPFRQPMPGVELDEETTAELDRIQQIELEVAHADFECAAELEKTRRQVQWELEAEFIEENAERLAGYTAEYEKAIADYLHFLDGP